MEVVVDQAAVVRDGVGAAEEAGAAVVAYFPDAPVRGVDVAGLDRQVKAAIPLAGAEDVLLDRGAVEADDGVDLFALGVDVPEAEGPGAGGLFGVCGVQGHQPATLPLKSRRGWGWTYWVGFSEAPVHSTRMPWKRSMEEQVP